jgi:medium-chain acyl-[acyl-carrier-protein] hydrolase
MKRTDLDRWLSYTNVAADGRTNVFCLPFAGGGASFYRAWMRWTASIALCPLQPPGREERFVETPFDSMEPFVRAATDALLPHLSHPYALFGHSMGALVSFEIMRALRERGAPLPMHLFVSGAPAPQLASAVTPIFDLPEERFFVAVKRYGGLPEEVMQSRELLDLLIPRLRADLAVTGTYVYAPQPPFDVPITAFAGIGDHIVLPSLVEGWGAQSVGAFQFERFAGGHFFITEHAREIVLKLAAALA